ncbi:MAG: hypothetical protein J5985_05725 [Kiritimatiellae bacterium]|nr:hypothetical protein [Kiritimatiellia bacterium]
MSSFSTEQIQLSMYNTETGDRLKANVYTLENVVNVDGSPRLMSIGQLVMAICLQRAAGLEEQIIDLMEDMNENTVLLEDLTDIEQMIVDSGDSFNSAQTYVTKSGRTTTYAVFLQEAGVTTEAAGTWNAATIESVVSSIEDKMDSLNTISQEFLIQLQSLTAKRDQTYDLVSNILKSFNTVLIGNANNL